jgi:hypothetical protein
MNQSELDFQPSRPMPQETSLEAWHIIQSSGALGRQQLECLRGVVALGGNATAFELENWWREQKGFDPARQVMGKRISELVDCGVLEQIVGATRINPTTGRQSNTYRLTGRTPRKPGKRIRAVDHSHDPRTCESCRAATCP